MRAIWSGTVAFGLVSVPVKLYSATHDHDISLHQVHDADGGRIRYERRCEVCGRKVDYQNIDKAYDDGENTVVITDEDLKALPAREDKEIEVVQFVPDEQIDPMTFEKSYYLEPASKSAKAYILLRRTLDETARTAIVKFSLRSKTRLAALRVRDDVIVLQTMLWADEVREPEFESTTDDVKISPREMKMSRALVEQFSEEYEPDRFVDEYQEELRTLIAEKLEHGDALDTDATFGEVDEEDAEEAGGDVIDLMEALKRSVDAKRQGKPDSERPAAKKARSTRKKATDDEAESEDKSRSDDKPEGKSTSPKSADESSETAAAKKPRSRRSTKKPAAKSPAKSATNPSSSKSSASKSEPKGTSKSTTRKSRSSQKSA